MSEIISLEGDRSACKQMSGDLRRGTTNTTTPTNLNNNKRNNTNITTTTTSYTRNTNTNGNASSTNTCHDSYGYAIPPTYPNGSSSRFSS